MHNREAPNEHNRLCSRKSVWEVMWESNDFRYNNNPPRDIAPPKPVFTVVKPDIPRFVLVLDTSGSMNTEVSKFLIDTHIIQK